MISPAMISHEKVVSQSADVTTSGIHPVNMACALSVTSLVNYYDVTKENDSNLPETLVCHLSLDDLLIGTYL